MITIDRITYNVPIKVINRKVEMLYKNGKRSEDGVLHSELIGVYFNYDVEAGMSPRNVSDYTALWLKITEPVEKHEVVMPDVGGTRTFFAYFANIKDEVAKVGTPNHFRNLSFSVIATSPART